ncbi:18 kDa seed maturation protein [Camellia lanceoleosa]|uniref:18 kDa seed maturation protein n=1 Tax=Camellia lanceoleosa TaxID=1840588 RepID=A0ACC0FR33_9ERIC|nr:18 kDa seed maturation protein [Camellia lanceoleosa]
MQAAKNAAASAKETVANVAASAKAGLDKTKATMQEKVERVSAHDPVQKDMATQRKEEKINQAEYSKQEAREHNATARQSAAATARAGGGTQSYTTGGGMGMENYCTSGPNMSAGYGYGTSHHGTSNMTEGGMVGSQYPLGADFGAATENPVGVGGANTTAIGLNPRSTDAVYPSDVDIIGAGLNPMHNTNAGVGDHGGAPTSGYGTGGAYN